MITTHQDQERRALIISILATAGLSFLGILWGLAIGSQMILFDGFFGLIGIITSGLLLQASMLAAKKPSRLFPYGQQSTTPLVIGIQGFVILATLAYGAVESAITIRNGGSHFSPLVAIASIQSQFNLAEPIIRINKVGSKLYVEVDAYAAPEMTIAQEHEIRTLLEEKLKSLPYKIWLNLDLLPITESPARASDGQPIRFT